MAAVIAPYRAVHRARSLQDMRRVGNIPDAVSDREIQRKFDQSAARFTTKNGDFVEQVDMRMYPEAAPLVMSRRLARLAALALNTTRVRVYQDTPEVHYLISKCARKTPRQPDKSKTMHCRLRSTRGRFPPWGRFYIAPV